MMTRTQITVQEFWRQYAGQPYQLVNGEVVPDVQKGYLHEVITSRIMMCLDVHAEALYLGAVLGSGARFALSPIELRTADVAFVSQAKLAHLTDPEQYLPFAPDLMVEIVSPRFTSTSIQQKVEVFLGAGTQLVWVVDPTPKEVTVVFPNGDAVVQRGGEFLQGHHIIQGLALKVDDLFPPLETTLDFFHS